MIVIEVREGEEMDPDDLDQLMRLLEGAAERTLGGQGVMCYGVTATYKRSC